MKNITSLKCKFCDKCFLHASSLSRHAKQCSTLTTDITEPVVNIDENKFNQLYDMIMKQKEEIENLKIKHNEMDLIIQNQNNKINDLNTTIIKLQTNIIELSNTKANKVRCETNHIIEKKEEVKQIEKFNLDKYLQEDCSNAPNIEDFIDKSFKPDLSDFEKYMSVNPRTALGLAFTKCLSQLKQINCPIQVTDARRNLFKVKFRNEWIDGETGEWINSDLTTDNLYKGLARKVMNKMTNEFYQHKKQVKLTVKQDDERAFQAFDDKYTKIAVGIYDNFYNDKNDCDNFIHTIIKNCKIQK